MTHIDPNGVGFWRMDVGQVIVAAIMALAWFCSRLLDYGSLQLKVKSHDEWKAATDLKLSKQDEIIGEMAVAIAKLTTICEGMEHRMRSLEQERFNRWRK